jgi:hypothetical protein
VVAPVEPPRGLSGFTVRAVTDLLLPRRISVLGTLEAGSSGSRDLTLLAPSTEGVFAPGETRARARWTPGSHVRLSLTPRFRFGPGLFLGVGWHFSRRGADEFEPLDGVSIDGFGDETATQHRLAVELRYAAVEEPNVGSVPFPFEIMLRGSQSVAGSGGAPAEARAEVMVRARLHPRG